jgi:rhombotail lipoprotein
MTRISLFAVSLLILSGCVMTSGFNRDMLESRLHEKAEPATDENIKAIQTLSPQLHFPCRIAVALERERGDWHWTPKDRKSMEAWAGTLRQEGIASDVVFMSRMFMQGDTLTDLRACAARYGADVVLIVKGSAAAGYRQNPLSLFNLTVVGGFLVPGSHCDALFLIEGGLIDVNNGFLYASMESEGESSKLAPTFLIEEKDSIEAAKHDALPHFGEEVLLRMRNLRASGIGTPPVALKE